MKQILILIITSLVLSGCWLNNPGAWKSSGTQEQVTPPPAGGSTVAPTQTVEELEAEDAALNVEMDADFKSIDTDLKRLDEELKNY